MDRPTFHFTREPSPEVLAYFRNKGYAVSFDWRDVWPAEHAHAFTVAKATQLGVLRTIREEVDRAIASGLPFEEFQKALEPRLKRLGWWGRQPTVDPETGETVLAQLGSPARLRIIYEANIRTANAAGAWERIWRTRDALPFLIYQETTSTEPRDHHLVWAHQPVVLPVEDPWWHTHYPPNGWQCKCWVLQIDEDDARAAGWTPGTKAPEVVLVDWFNTRTGETEQVPEGIDAGWATNPGLTRANLLDAMLSGRIDDLDPDLKGVLLKDIASAPLYKAITEGGVTAKPNATPLFGTWKGGPLPDVDVRAPAGHLDAALQGKQGLKSGVVWVDPAGAGVIRQVAGAGGKVDWHLLPRVIDEGAVIRSEKEKGWLTVYRTVDGNLYKAEVMLRDRVMPGLDTKLAGGPALRLESFRRIDGAEAKLAAHEIMMAKGEGRLLRAEQLGAAPGKPHSLSAAAVPKWPSKLAGKKGEPAPPATAPRAPVAPPHLSGVMAEVQALGWQGKALPLDKDLIEDHNVLAFTVWRNGKPYTVFQARLREEAEGKVGETLRKLAGAPVRGAGPLPEDKFHGHLLDGVRKVNRAFAAGKPLPPYFSLPPWLRKDLVAASKGADEAVAAMARHYLDWLDKIETAARAGGKAQLPHFSRFSWTPPPPTQSARPGAADIAVTRLKTLSDEERSIDQRRLVAGRKRVDRGQGQQLEVTFPDGSTASYRPWVNENAYAFRGHLEVVVPGAASDATLATAVRHMERMGLAAAAASPVDLELAYLRRQAAAASLDRDPAYKTLIGTLARRKASAQEEVNALVGYWEKRLGVKDLRSSERWNPDGDYQPGIAGTQRGGRRVHWRFDVTDGDVAREMAGYRVHHHNTGGRSLVDLIGTVLESGGYMMAQTERMRTGTSSSGMSQGADQQTGGARYFFTRVREINNAAQVEGGFYWRPELLRRLDTITYESDLYGRVTGDTRAKNHLSGIKGWKKASHRGSNETIFKDGLSLLEHLDFIVAGSPDERSKLIAVFKRHGITTIGGAPVESRIYAPAGWGRPVMLTHGEFPTIWGKPSAALPFWTTKAKPKGKPKGAPVDVKTPPSVLQPAAAPDGPMPFATTKAGKPKVPSLKAIGEHKKMTQTVLKEHLAAVTALVGSKPAAQLLFSQITTQEHQDLVYKTKDASALIAKYKLSGPMALLGKK